jgi:hypothetical protein
MKKIENKTRRRVTFSFASLDAKEVFVAGTFNGWDPHRIRSRCITGWKAVKYLTPGITNTCWTWMGTGSMIPRSKRRSNLRGENCNLDVCSRRGRCGRLGVLNITKETGHKTHPRNPRFLQNTLGSLREVHGGDAGQVDAMLT